MSYSKHFFSLACSLLVGLVVFGMSGNSHAGQFQNVETETLSEKTFVFPTDLKGEKHNILFLAMGDSKESGQAQQKVLVAWQKALDSKGTLPTGVMPYHLSVMKSPPFFVKGIISGAMADSYKENNVSLDQAAILFVDDLGEFAKSADLAIDNQATVVVTDAQIKTQLVLKGAVDDAKLAQLLSAIKQ